MSASETDHPCSPITQMKKRLARGTRHKPQPNPFSFSFLFRSLLTFSSFTGTCGPNLACKCLAWSPTIHPPLPPLPLAHVCRPCRTPTLEHPPDSRAAKLTRLWVMRLCCARRWTRAWAPSRLPVAHALPVTRSRAPGGALAGCLQIECCPLTQAEVFGTYFSFFPILCSPPYTGIYVSRGPLTRSLLIVGCDV